MSFNEISRVVSHSPFGHEDVVCQPMGNDAPHTLLNHVRQHRECRRRASISLREDIDVGALCPIRVERCVNGSFDVVAGEIYRESLAPSATKGVEHKDKFNQECAYGKPRISHSGVYR